MNPLLRSPRNLVLALLAWSPLAAGIVLLGARAGGMETGTAALLLAPPLLAGFLLSPAAWYACRFVPLQWRRIHRLFLAHGAGGAFFSLLMLALALLYGALSDLLLRLGWTRRLWQLAPLLLLAGLSLYLLAVLFSYLVLAVEESARREREAVEERLASSRAELRALRATIHPHFLFNSLTALAALIPGAPAQARALCLDLASFLRYSLLHGRVEWVALADEVEHVRAYLAIEQARLGDRLTWSCAVPAGLAGWRLPALTLLPLVENAVKYGVSSHPLGGAVVVSLQAEGDGLRVAVENPEPPGDAPRPAGAGLGLSTLAARLALQYGREVRPRMERGGGTVTVSLRLPAAPGVTA